MVNSLKWFSLMKLAMNIDLNLQPLMFCRPLDNLPSTAGLERELNACEWLLSILTNPHPVIPSAKVM